MNVPVKSIDLIDHFTFPQKEDLFNFLYIDFPMNIFGHAGSSENSTFHVLNDIYLDLRDNHDLNIISDEIGKSKPATLFFLSKYGCQLETIKFYSTITENWVWENSDIIITSNPKLLEKKIEGKVLIKYETTYNVESYSDYTIKTLEEFKELYKTLTIRSLYKYNSISTVPQYIISKLLEDVKVIRNYKKGESFPYCRMF